MKFFILLAIVCATIGYSEQAITKEQAIEMMKKIADECAGKEGASAADIEEVFAKKPPSAKTGKCLHACMAEKIGMIKDNKMSVEGNIALTKMAFDNDADKIQKSTEITNECLAVTDADRCEAAWKIIQCAEKGAKARGISFDD